MVQLRVRALFLLIAVVVLNESVFLRPRANGADTDTERAPVVDSTRGEVTPTATGDVAQMVERAVSIGEVKGSMPFFSTFLPAWRNG